MPPESELGQAKIPIVPDVQGFDKELDKSRAKLQSKLGGVFSKLGGTLANVGKKVAVTGLKAFTGAAVAATAALATTIGPASDLDETMSKVGVVFGEQAAEVKAFGATAATALGMSTEAALSAAGTYGNLFRSMGMTEKVSADMSTGLVSLAADLASFNNMDPTEVLDKLRAGLSGETEPLKSLGVNLNASAVEAKALQMGLASANVDMTKVTAAQLQLETATTKAQEAIAKHGAESIEARKAANAVAKAEDALAKAFGGEKVELTAAAKAQATYALVMEQTSLAQGDFARTSDGLANQQRILSATMTDLRANVGLALLPIVTKLTGMFNNLVQNDKVQVMIENITDTLARFVESASTVMDLFMAGDITGGLTAMFGEDVVATVQNVVATISTFVDKLGGLDAILNAVAVVVGGILVVAFYSWATAAWAAAAPMLPLYALVGAIIAVVAAAALAWQNDWGGIRTVVTDFWNNTAKPIFDTLVTWLQTNIPKALNALAGFWTGTLLPAIQTVGAWITDTLVPVFQTIWEWLQTNVPLALQTLSDFWTNTLLPAITAVWDFIQGSVVPLFQSLVSVYIAALQVALTALTGLWENVLLPALQSVWGFIQDNLVPILETLGGWIGETLPPMIETFKGWIEKAATAISGGLVTAIETVTGFLDGLKSKLEGMKGALPDWLTPGSPTPMENGLRGIAGALGPVINELKDFASSLSGGTAQAVKNVASAFKDMAKGIDKLSQSMARLDALEPATGAAKFDLFAGWLDQYETILGMAMGKINDIVNLIGYKQIKELRKSARRMGDIIEAVLVDLSAIKERQFPNLDVWFGQFYDFFSRAMAMLSNILNVFGKSAVEMAADVAGSVGTVLQILGTDLAAIIPPPPNFEVLLGVFLAALILAAEAIIPWLGDLRILYGGTVLSEARKAAEDVMTIVGVLGLSEVMASLSKEENQAGDNVLTLVQTLMDNLSGALDILMPGLIDIESRWGEALERIAGIVSLMQQVFTGARDAHVAALEFVAAEDIDMSGLMHKIGSLGAATGAAVTGLTPSAVGAGAGVGGGMPITINLYLDDELVSTYTDQTNDAGETDIDLAEAMSN